MMLCFCTNDVVLRTNDVTLRVNDVVRPSAFADYSRTNAELLTDGNIPRVNNFPFASEACNIVCTQCNIICGAVATSFARSATSFARSATLFVPENALFLPKRTFE